MADLEDIVSIEKRVFRHPWSRNQIKWELEHKKGKLNLVLIENITIGYMMVQKVKNEAQILNVAMDVPYQHQGYGKKLLEYTLNDLGTETDVFLEVRKSNLPAIKLYCEFDFEDIGIRLEYYSDGEDAIIMHKKSNIYGLV